MDEQNTANSTNPTNPYFISNILFLGYIFIVWKLSSIPIQIFNFDCIQYQTLNNNKILSKHGKYFNNYLKFFQLPTQLILRLNLRFGRAKIWRHICIRNFQSMYGKTNIKLMPNWLCIYEQIYLLFWQPPKFDGLFH